MKRFKEILNQSISRILGVTFLGLGVFFKLKYGKEGFNGTDLFIITVSIPLGVIFIANPTHKIVGFIKEKIEGNINFLKELFKEDDYEEYEDYDEPFDHNIKVEEEDYEDEDDYKIVVEFLDNEDD